MPWREATEADGEVAVLCGCHIWTGYTDANGTPVVRTATSQTTAARAAYEREVGPIPKGLVLYALCNQALCVRPSHHEPVTWRTLRYRQGHTKRDRHMARAAFRLKALGWSRRRIARNLGVTDTTVRKVLAGDFYDPSEEES